MGQNLQRGQDNARDQELLMVLDVSVITVVRAFRTEGGYQSFSAIDHECKICRKFGHYKEFCNDAKASISVW